MWIASISSSSSAGRSTQWLLLLLSFLFLSITTTSSESALSAAGYGPNCISYKCTYQLYTDDLFDFTNATTTETILMLGVGTSMKSTDYSMLGHDIVRGRPGIIAVVVDFMPGDPFKFDPLRFVDATNAILDELSPQYNEATMLIVGGHSAGGYAAASTISISMDDLYRHYHHLSPGGYVGLDPVPPGFGPFPGRFMVNITTVPSFVVGFRSKSCGVDPLRSGRAAYIKSNPTHRTLLEIRNPSGEYRHCMFTDNGCGVLGCLVACPKMNGSRSASSPIGAVSAAFDVFLGTVPRGRGGGSNANVGAYQSAIGRLPVDVVAVDADEVWSKADRRWWQW